MRVVSSIIVILTRDSIYAL